MAKDKTLTLTGKTIVDANVFLKILGNHKVNYDRFITTLKEFLANETIKIGDEEIHVGNITGELSVESAWKAICKAVYHGLSIGKTTGESWLAPKGVGYVKSKDDKGNEIRIAQQLFQLYIGRNGYIKKAKEMNLLLAFRVIPLTTNEWLQTTIRHSSNGDSYSLDRKLTTIIYESNGRMKDVGGYLVELTVPGNVQGSRKIEVVPVPLEKIERIRKQTKTGQFNLDKNGKQVFSPHTYHEDEMDAKQATVVAIRSMFFGTPFQEVVQEQESIDYDWEAKPKDLESKINGRVEELTNARAPFEEGAQS